MPRSEAVANPPAGGPQEFASTNDDNINDALHGRPYVVAISAHGQLGVHSRYATQAEAEAAASAVKAKRPQRFVDVRVVKENDPADGLPALLAKVEAEEFGVADEDQAKASTPKASAAK